jgi:soluble lytic murein transglycosylase
VVFIRFRQLRLLFIALVIILSVVYVLQARWFWKIFYPWPYRTEITGVARDLDMDPCLLAALIRVESRFNTYAESEVGARGLMQVMPETASWAAAQIGIRDFHKDQLYRPEVNLLIGSWYLDHLFKGFEGNQVAGLAAYNAGRGNVQAWLATGQWEGTIEDAGHIPFPETQLYLQAVIRDYNVYKFLYEGQDGKTAAPEGKQASTWPWT